LTQEAELLKFGLLGRRSTNEKSVTEEL